MGHTLHHQGLNLDAEMLHAERATDQSGRAAPDGTAAPGPVPSPPVHGEDPTGPAAP
jgi:hypothetical protein